MLFIVPAGICLDRHGTRLTVALSMVVALSGLTAFLLFPSYATAILWRSAMGVMGAVSFTGPMTLVANTAKPYWIARTIGCFGLIIMVAGILAQTAVKWLMLEIGTFLTLWLDGALGVAVLILVVCNRACHSRGKVYARVEWQMLRRALLHIRNLRTALFAGLTNLPLPVLGAVWGNVYLTSVHRLSADQAARVLTALFAGNIAGAMGFGLLADMTKSRSSLWMLTGSILYLISLAGLTPYLSAGTPDYLRAVLFLMGLSSGCQTLAYATMIDAHPPDWRGRAISLVSFVSLGVGATTQVVCGYIRISHIQTLLVFGAVASMALALLASRHSHGRPLPTAPAPE
jgi:MFS family permease